MSSLTFTGLIVKNLIYHFRSHIGTLLGVAIGTAVITGALLVGDSTRNTLKNRALERLGWVNYGLSATERFFSITLEDRFAKVIDNGKGIRVVALLRLPGTISTADSTARANRINVLGVRSNFWIDGFSEKFQKMPERNVILNVALAEHLKARVGDEVIIRVRKPSVISIEMPISLQEEAVVGLRVKVYAIINPAEMGNFSFLNNQLPPFNAFMRYEDLSKATGLDNKANVLLTDYDGSRPRISAFDLNISLNKALNFEDCELKFSYLSKDILELKSGRVFIERAVVNSLLSVMSSQEWLKYFGMPPVLVSTYLANLIKHKDRATPYSIISAVTPPLCPPDLKEDEIIINQWLAEDLNAKVGDTIELTYYLPESALQLTERTNKFRIKSVVPMELPYADRTLLPDIPGLAKAESTQDWNLGFPLVHRIREKDDDYWRKYRGTPKAFVSLSAGTKMWANRFGDLTAVRIKISSPEWNDKLVRQLEKAIISNCSASALGFSFEPLRADALLASAQSQDFASLFLGFSMFLIASALLMVILVYQLSLEKRTSEFGTYIAVGFTGEMLKKLILIEAIFVVILGSIIGIVSGRLYSQLMISGLNTVWREAAGYVQWQFYGQPLTYLVGFILSITVCLVVILMSVRKFIRRPLRELLSPASEFTPISIEEFNANKSRKSILQKIGGLSSRARFYIDVFIILCGIVIVGWLIVSHQTANAPAFFCAGALLLAGALSLYSNTLKNYEIDSSTKFNLIRLSVRNCIRRPKRSFLTVAMLSCGCFIIISITAFRLDVSDYKKKSSGTGGFSLMAESALPIVKDLNTREGLEFYGINPELLKGVKFVPMRVREGDDATCLNPNRVQRPKILGVKPGLLYGRFSFSLLPGDYSGTNGWELLKAKQNSVMSSREDILAIGDAESIQWALGKKIGDFIVYNTAPGSELRLQIIGGVRASILQGYLIIDESEFRMKIPDESGYRFFLIETPFERADEVAKILSRSLSDYGFEITKTQDRLSAFYAIQNTYIGAFQALGAIGLLLGTAGIGIIQIRNIIERRNELAILLAVGYRKPLIQLMVCIEYIFLVLCGLVIGVVSAVVAITPSFVSGDRTVSVKLMIILIISVVITSLFWTFIASFYAIKGKIIEALRTE